MLLTSSFVFKLLSPIFLFGFETMESRSVRRSTRVRMSPPRLSSDPTEPQQQQKTPAKMFQSLYRVAAGGSSDFSVTSITTISTNSSSRRTRSKLPTQTIELNDISPRTTSGKTAVKKAKREKKKNKKLPVTTASRRRRRIVLKADDDYSDNEEEEEGESDNSDNNFLSEEEASTKKKISRVSKKRPTLAPVAKAASRRKSKGQVDDAPNQLKLTRKRNTDDKRNLSPEEAIQAAMDHFHSSSVPDSLPCRKTQFDSIYAFVEQNLHSGGGGCMYISGVPGIGKTTTLYKVKRTLEENRCHLPAFKWVEINGVRLGDPKQFYRQLHMELTGEKFSFSKALNALNDRFSNKNRGSSSSTGKPFTTVLFIDELDFLRTKTLHLLYNIFDWPNREGSRLVVLAIANTMDLPERLLLKFSSRIAFSRSIFSPYTYQELEQIVASRLEDLSGRHHVRPDDVFEPDALQLICRKVAAYSGDARRVLDIARRSAEITIAGENQRTTVTMADVCQAMAEIFNSVNILRVKGGSSAERTFLRALLTHLKATGLEEARFIDVYMHYAEICRLEGESSDSIATTSELAKVAANLDSSKVIYLQKSPSHLYRRVSLLINADDVTFALKSDE
ncbi:Origin recognition complex, subunit 1 [Tyrophagus putrescentiae]|nr:Origin recognition complex, subunit 1 [Tyrophagus putrescentiae]